MFVCSCRAVTDREIAEVIDSGASTVDDIAASCAAGSRCGGCRPQLQRLLGELCGHGGMNGGTNRGTRVALAHA